MKYVTSILDVVILILIYIDIFIVWHLREDVSLVFIFIGFDGFEFLFSCIKSII